MSRSLVCLPVLLLFMPASAQKHAGVRQVPRVSADHLRYLGAEFYGPFELPSGANDFGPIRWHRHLPNCDVTVRLHRNSANLVEFSIDVDSRRKPSAPSVEVVVVDQRSTRSVFRSTISEQMYLMVGDGSGYEASARTGLQLPLRHGVTVEIRWPNQVPRSPIFRP